MPPFFFPLKDTLALSEHLLGITVFTAPVVWLTGNAVLAYNLATLGLRTCWRALACTC